MLFHCRTCTGTRIEVEWTKPKTYGDAFIEKYLLRLDGCDYADVSGDMKSYMFSMCEPGTSYVFQLQVSSRYEFNISRIFCHTGDRELISANILFEHLGDQHKDRIQ